MSDLPNGLPKSTSKARRSACAVGLRVVVWGGLLAAVVFYVLGPRSLWMSSVSMEPLGVAEQAGDVASPGWPHWRGPRYDAVSSETDLADAWPAEGPPVLWTRELGCGYSGFIAVGGRVYTQRQTLSEQTLLCLDAATGRTIWEHRYAWPYESGGLYPGPRSTPTYADGRIYFADPDGLVGCLRADSGLKIWSVNVNQKFGGRGTSFGYSCTPLVEDGRVILPVGGEGASVVALDARDGSTLWTSGDEPASYCSAMPVTFGGSRLVIAFLQNYLSAFDAASGRLLWEQRYSSGYDEHAAAPLYREPYLMVMIPFQAGADLYRFEVMESQPQEADSQGEAERLRTKLLWHSREMSNDVASSVLVGDCVYGFDLRELQTNRHRPSRGKLKCLDFLTGKVRWSTDRVGHATVLAADGKLFMLNDKGEAILARANPDQYEELGRVSLFGGEQCWTAPALDQGRLFLRSPSRAVCLFVGKPEQLTDEDRDRMRRVSELPRRIVFNPAWLVGGELEFPYVAPDLVELRRWFLYSLGVLAIAAAAGASIAWLARRKIGWAAFWLLALVLGIAATPLANRWSEAFVFTWPVTLFASQQLTLQAVLRARRLPQSPRSTWLIFATMLLWFALGLTYYDLCRRLTLAITWVFLVGFLPSWPLALPAARSAIAGSRPAVIVVWHIAAFTLYYWASCAVLLLRPVADG